MFEGGNLEGWVFRVEKLFSIHRLTKMEKLDMATLSFDGEALAWFQWEDQRRSLSSWANLKSRLLDCFGMTQEGSLCERFLALRQEGFVREFCQTF